MSELRITFCDLCNVSQNFDRHSDEDQVVDADDPNFILCNGTGYVLTDAEAAVAERGWIETDYGHQCPPCFADEEEQNALDEATGAESGATVEPVPVLDAIDFDGEDGQVHKPTPPAPGKKLRRKKS